jgi:uncharacterized membrane protein
MNFIKTLLESFLKQSKKNKLSIIFSIVGILVSSYLWYEFIGPKSVVCPINNFGANCAEVMSSPSSIILGVHMSVYGFFFFGLALLFLFQKLLLKSKVIDYMLVSLATVGFAFTMMLRIVELVVVKSWCPWCWLVFAATIGLFITSLLDAKEKN